MNEEQYIKIYFICKCSMRYTPYITILAMYNVYIIYYVSFGCIKPIDNNIKYHYKIGRPNIHIMD